MQYSSTVAGRAGDNGGASRPAFGGERRVWWVAFGLILAACVAWAAAVPPLTGPDEWAHAYRAAAVARGELTGTKVDNTVFGDAIVEVDVPEALVQEAETGRCFLGNPREQLISPIANDIASCPEPGGTRTLVTTTTSEHRGQPIYYVLVGLPTLAFPGTIGSYLMRFVGAALCSALLASAVVSLLRLRPNRLVVVGGAVALTPAMFYFAAVTNTAGVEMAASLGLYASGAALVRSRFAVDGRLVARAGVALVALVLSRGLSPAFALLAAVVLVLVAPPGRVRGLLARTDVRVWATAGAVAAVASAVWVLWVHQEFDLPPRAGIGLVDGLGELSWDLRDLVGMFGSTDVNPPWPLQALWAAVALVVVAVGWRVGGRREVLLAGLMTLGAVAMLTTGEGLNFPDTGFWWQGRYVAPPIIGALVIATLGRRPTEDDAVAAGADGPADSPGAGLVRRLGPPVIAVLVVIHAWSFLYAVRHYSVGWQGPANPLDFLTDTLWAPPVAPAAVWAAVYVGSLAVGAALLWRASAWPVGPVGTAGDAAAVPAASSTGGVENAEGESARVAQGGATGDRGAFVQAVTP
jgi:hypothetical protein